MAKKKAGGKDDRKINDDNSNQKPSIQITEKNHILGTQCLLLADQLAKYQHQTADSARLASTLRQELKKQDLKTTEMVAYLQNEIAARDIQIEKLKTENIGIIKKIEIETKKNDLIINEKQEKQQIRYNNAVNSFQEQINNLKSEIKALEYVKKHKDEIETSLLTAKATMETQAKKFKLSLEQLESKYIIDTQRIRVQCDKKISQIKARASETAEQELDAHSRQLRAQNKRLKDDLTFHADTTSQLHQANDQLTQKIAKLEREINLNNDKETAVAKLSVNHKNKIKQLTSKIDRLQTTLNTATEEWDRIRETMTNEFNRELQIQKQFLKQSENKCSILQKNNALLKKHSSILLSQRSELEEFFYDALDQVKQEILKSKEDEFEHDMTQYGDMLATIGLSAQNIHDQSIAKNELSIAPPSKPPTKFAQIKLQDLTWKQKEHVLKVLIMKMNMSNQDITSQINKNQIEIKKPIHDINKTDSKVDDRLPKSRVFLTQKEC